MAGRAKTSKKPAGRKSAKRSLARKPAAKKPTAKKATTKPAAVKKAASRKAPAKKFLFVAAVSGFPTKPGKENFLIDIRDQKGRSMRLEMDHLTAQWLVEHMREEFRLRRIQ